MSSGAPTANGLPAGTLGGEAAFGARSGVRSWDAASRQLGICRHPGLRAVDGGAVVRVVPSGDWKIAG